MSLSGRTLRRLKYTATLLTAITFSASYAANGSAQCVPGICSINVEAVNNYTQCNCGLEPNCTLPNSIADAQGFLSGMTYPGLNPVQFQTGAQYYDRLVWTTDFYDPDRTGYPDDDWLYFDGSGDAFSYYSGHGSCDSGNTFQACTTRSTCTTPPSGTTFPAFCNRFPGDNYGTCSYTKMNSRALMLGNCTDGGGQVRGGAVNYSSPASYVRWGESPWAGGWAGAGTNGGVNVVLLSSSCAELSNRGHEVWPAFGGMHLLGNVLQHTGDTNNTATRGSWFALEYNLNPYISVSNAWVYSGNSITETTWPCTNASGTQTYGTGFGYNGCGGHVMTSMGATAAQSLGFINENFFQTLDDWRDANGQGYWHSRWACNYDCNAWPFSL